MKGIEDNKNTYTGCNINEKNIIKRLFKRLGRKLTFWYMHPFGMRQNEFNSQVSDHLSKIEEKMLLLEETAKSTKELAMLKNALKTLINEHNALRLRSTLNSNNLQKLQSDIEENNSIINDCLLEINPQARKNIVNPDCNELSSYGYAGLGEKISSLRKSGNNSPMVKTLLSDIEKTYIKGAKNELELLKARKESNTILIICVGLHDSLGMEAIRNEAYDLYKMFREKSIYNVKMISIEPNFTECIEKDNIIYIPNEQQDKIKQCIMEINPHLCILYESTAFILLMGMGILFKKKCIIKLTAQNPLYGIDKRTIEELCHFNDYGVHKYCVESKKAYDIMLQNGFKEPEIFMPVIDINKNMLKASKKSFDKTSIVAGFASSPMLADQMEGRGMNIFSQLIKLMPEVTFKILWRNENLEVPEHIVQAKNTIIEYGKYDMQKFYSEIDFLVIPYTSLNFNHACSLSAIEAILNGIPVVATKVSGISEVLEYSKMGEVADNNAEALAEASKRIIQNHAKYNRDDSINMIKQYLSGMDMLKMVENEMKIKAPKGVVMLGEWENLCNQKGKYLVKGQENMKKYYQDMEVAENYNATRFMSYPENVFDLMERKSINVIIEDYFDKKDLEILDIACGDGRILQEDLRYGKCTAVDSSKAMLKIVQNKFESLSDRLNTIHTDYFEGIIEGQFDIITTFRYIRHFEYAKRKQLYDKLKKSLKPNGLLIFDVPNIYFEMKQKEVHGWGGYNIYDVFWNKEDFIKEMKINGFSVKYLIPIGQGLADFALSEYRLEPMTWTVAVRKL